MYLNSFRFLIGMPGAGKSMVSDLMQDILKTAQIDVPIAPSSVTRASLVDALASEEARRLWGLDASESVSTMLIAASEYAVFIGEHGSPDIMTRTMCELFDGRTYTERRRSSKDNYVVKNPYVNFLACTQPEHFMTQFPPKVWQGGYASRCDFYYSDMVNEDPEQYMDYVEEESDDTERKDFLRSISHDLQWLLTKIDGKTAQQIPFTKGGADRFRHWYEVERTETALEHPHLLDYNVRRPFRLRRDVANFTLARGDCEFKTTEADVERAIAMHLESEQGLMKVIYKAGQSEDSDVAKNIYYWVRQQFLEKRKPVAEHVLIEYVGSRTDTYKIDNIINYLVKSQLLIKSTTTKTDGGNIIPLKYPVFMPNFKPSEQVLKSLSD